MVRRRAGVGAAERRGVMVAQGARVDLRTFAPDDAPFVLALLTDPDWLRFIGDRGVRDLEGARGWIATGPVALLERCGHALYVVERRSDRAALGTCGLVRRPGLDDADLGFAFLPAFRGQGYALEAARLTLEHARTLGLRRVVAITAEDNAASARLLERVGMRDEGYVTLPGIEDPQRLFALDLEG